MGFYEVFSGVLAGLYAILTNYGLAIIGLTLLSRIVMLPLTVKQTRSMRKMQALQPEMNRIKAKHKNNKQKMNEEMMALYKETGVNPFGSCLPLLLQMPIFFALFAVLRAPLDYMGYELSKGAWKASEVAGTMQSIQDSSLAQGLLDAPDTVNNFLGILRLDCSAQGVLPFLEAQNLPGAASPCPHGWLQAIPYVLLLVAMGVTTWYQQKQMQASQDPNNPAAQQARTMGRIMGFVFLFFGFTFPVGLVLYWTTSNLWGIAQQHILMSGADDTPVPVRTSKGSDGKSGAKAKAATAKAKGKATNASSSTSNGGKTPAKSGSRPHPSSKKKKKR